MLDFTGKVVLVTGAGGEIGKTTMELFVRQDLLSA